MAKHSCVLAAIDRSDWPLLKADAPHVRVLRMFRFVRVAAMSL